MEKNWKPSAAPASDSVATRGGVSVRVISTGPTGHPVLKSLTGGPESATAAGSPAPTASATPKTTCGASPAGCASSAGERPLAGARTHEAAHRPESAWRPEGERRREDRRKRRFSFVWHERRSGFDRRAPGPGASRSAVLYRRLLLGLRDRPRLLGLLLILVNVFNLADFSLTVRVLAQGGQEANPILRSLFAADPLYAAAFKGAAVLLTTWVVWRCRRFRSGLEAALIMVGVFGAVLVYHLFGLTALS